MASEADIIQRLVLEGTEQAKAQLRSLGAEGAVALKRLETASKADLTRGLTRLQGVIPRINSGLNSVGSTAGRLTGVFSRVTTSIGAFSRLDFASKLNSGFNSVLSTANKFSQGMEGVGRRIGTFGKASEGAVPILRNFSSNLIATTASVSKYIAALTGLGGFGLVKFFSSSATAAEETKALAASMGIAIPKFQQLELAAASTLLPAQKFGKFMLELQGNITKVKETGASEFFDKVGAAAQKSQGGLEGLDGNVRKLGADFSELGKGMGVNFDAGLQVIAGGVNRFGSLSKIILQGAKTTDNAMVVAGGNVRQLGEVMLDPIKTLGILSDAFIQIKDPAKQSSLVMEEFGGKIALSILPFLRLGSEGINDLMKSFENMTAGSQARIDILEGMEGAIEKLIQVFSFVKDAIAAAFAPGITAVVSAFSNALVRSFDTIENGVKEMAKTVEPAMLALAESLNQNPDQVGEWIVAAIGNIVSFGKTVASVVSGVVQAFQFLKGGFDTVAGAVNTLTGGFTNFSGLGIIVALALAKVTGAFALLAGAMNLIGAGIAIVFRLVTFATSLTPVGLAIRLVIAALVLLVPALTAVDWAGFGKRAVEIFNSIVSTVSGWARTVVGYFNSVVEGAKGIWNTVYDSVAGFVSSAIAKFKEWYDSVVGFFKGIPGAVNGVWEEIKTAALGALQPILDFVGRIIDKVKEWASAAVDAARKMASAKSEESGTRRARGGSVWGAGTSTSDSIPAWLSNGEYVLKAAAVKKYGIGFLNALNNMRLGKSMMRGFNMGGLAESLSSGMHVPRLRFAEGGAVSSGGARTPINLTIGAEEFSGLLAPEEVANKLVRFAMSRQIRSAGTKPGYYGGGR